MLRNRAYVEIYKRFNILNKEIVISKPLLTAYYPVPPDFLYPISAVSSENVEIPINSDRLILDDNGVDTNISVLFPTPGNFTIKGIPTDRDLIISINYAAGPQTLTGMGDTVILPFSYFELLFNYVAYKAFEPTAPEGIQSKADIYFRRYLNNCKEIEERGLVSIDNLDSNEKLEERGFV